MWTAKQLAAQQGPKSILPPPTPLARALQAAQVDQLLEIQHLDPARLYGLSLPMLTIVSETVPHVAACHLHVLVTGEAGTGKGRLVHAMARAAGTRLLSVHCAALPKQAADVELFGVRKGAMAGAAVTRNGLLQQAGGGALFLDELGELPPSTQAKLVNVIQEGRFFRVGDASPTPIHVRLFATATTPRRLRDDLRWRFPIQVELPPLRDRLVDVFAILQGLLAEKLNHRPAQWAIPWSTFVQMLYSPWYGNVRELENAADTSLALWRRQGSPPGPIVFTYIPPAHYPDLVRDAGQPSLAGPLWACLISKARGMDPGWGQRALTEGLFLSCGDALNLLAAVSRGRDKPLAIAGPEKPLGEVLVHAHLDHVRELPPEVADLYDEAGMRRRDAQGRYLDFAGMTWEQVTRAYLEWLTQHYPSRREAAERAGLSAGTLRSLLKRHLRSAP